jgi:hypothetical protein
LARSAGGAGLASPAAATAKSAACILGVRRGRDSPAAPAHFLADPIQPVENSMSENEESALAANSAEGHVCPVREIVEDLRSDVSEHDRDIDDAVDQILALTDAIIEIIRQMEPTAAGEVIFRIRTLERESSDPEHWGYRRRLRDLCDRANSRDG